MKNKAKQAVKAYRDAYVESARKIAVIRANTDLTAEAKQARIDKLKKEHDAVAMSLRNEAVEAVNLLNQGIKNKRVKDIQEGLKQAEAINLICTGIKDGSYSEGTLKEIIQANSGNRIALESIKGALMSTGKEDMIVIGAGIPVSNSERVTRNLDRCVDNLNHVPDVANNDVQDWNSALYRSGHSFDNMMEYIEGISDDITDDIAD